MSIHGITAILRSIFVQHGADVSYEVAAAECKRFGLDLNIGTFRTTKCNYKKEVSVTGSTPVAPSISAPRPIHAVAMDTVQETVSDTPVEAELAEYFTPPTVDSTHILNKDLESLFNAINIASKKGQQNVRLNGPAGCGKTTTAMEFAARFKRPLLVMDCANIREPRDWFGFRNIDSKTGTVVWHKSLFYKFVQHNNAVIVLDEINRINPMICNTLLPLLDGRRKTYLEEAGETLRVGSGVVFFATTNEGREFSGTISLDLANADRLSTLIECNYLDPINETSLLANRTGIPEADASKLVSVANHVRKKATSDCADTFSKAISTRMLLNAAEHFKNAGPSTLRYTLLNHFSGNGGETSERAQLLKLLQGKFGPVCSA